MIVLPGLAHINCRQVILEGIKFEKYDKIEYYMYHAWYKAIFSYLYTHSSNVD